MLPRPRHSSHRYILPLAFGDCPCTRTIARCFRFFWFTVDGIFTPSRVPQGATDSTLLFQGEIQKLRTPDLALRLGMARRHFRIRSNSEGVRARPR